MNRSAKWKRGVIVAVFCTAVLALVLVSCTTATVDRGEPYSSVANDTVTIGEYDVFNPEVKADETGGEAIEGSEEDELQQERIAGGAVGGVQSKNLEALEGITDGSERDYVPSLGMRLQAPVQGHAYNGYECQSCHYDGGSGRMLLDSHVGDELTDAECASCHAPIS